MPLEHIASFGPFRFDLSIRELRKHGTRLRLEEKPAQVLQQLLENAGAVVSRQELHKLLWPDGIHVDFDHGLNKAINRLRRVLGDDCDQPHYIETLSRRGYRFIARVDFIAPAEAARALGPPGFKQIRERAHRSKLWALGAAPAAAAAVSVLLFAVAPQFFGRLLPRTQIHSLAVIVSAVSDQDLQAEILSEAASESVIRTLRGASDLKVIADHRLVSANGAAVVGRSLKCDAVLLIQGKRQGESFSARLETLDSRTGRTLWEETVTGRVTDERKLNANLNEVVTRRFNASRARERRAEATNAAFQEYVRGRYFWNKRTPDDLKQAFASFRTAIAEDPNFALAYAGLAQTYAVADLHDPVYHGREETYREGRQAAEHAIALDPGLASAHAALAQILRNYDRNMVAAEREYLKAIELDPADATTHQWYAEFLSINARHDEALAEIDRARELDPLSAVITAVCGTIRIQAGRYADSLPFAEEALRLDPHYASIYTNVAQAMEGEGRYLEAIDALAKRADVAGDVLAAAAAREDKAAYLRGGPRGLYSQRLKRVLKQSSQPDQAYVLAVLYCQLGDKERCLGSLEKAVSERSETVTGIKIEPQFDLIRDDARYAALVIKFGFASNDEQARSFAPSTGSRH